MISTVPVRNRIRELYVALMLRGRGDQVGPRDVGTMMDQWTTIKSTMLGSGYGEQKQQERRAELERRNCAFAVFHGVALLSTCQSWPTATPTTKSEMPRITWTAACIAATALMATALMATALITTALMATALTAQPTGMYLGASVGAARLTAPRGNFPRTTTPTIAVWAGVATTRIFGFEARLTGLSANVRQRPIPGVLDEGPYKRGVNALLLEPALTFRPTAWNAWRVKPFGSAGVVLAALRISAKSDTPQESAGDADAGVAGALGLEAVLQNRISLVGRANYRAMFTGSRGPQRQLGVAGPSLEFGVRVDR